MSEVTINDLFSIIGRKDVEILKLQRELAEANARVLAMTPALAPAEPPKE